MSRYKLPILFAVTFGSAASAQAPLKVVAEGDVVAGVGTVTSINNLAVNNSGTTLVEADTDNPDTDIDSVVLRGSALDLQEGQGLALPAGSTIRFFDSVNVNSNGDSGWNIFIDGTGSSFNDSGVYFNSTLVIQESDATTAPGFTPLTPYIGFLESKMNDSNQIALIASLDDPAISSTVDRAIMRIDLDGSGALLSETAILKEGDAAPGVAGFTISDFGIGAHEFAINNAGDVMYGVDLTGGTAQNAIYLNETPLAVDGAPSPVAGRNWNVLFSAELDLNNVGDFVFNASIDGPGDSSRLLVKNGAKFRQQGDTLPAIGGVFAFEHFGTGPVCLNDSGEVLWFGNWDDADLSVDEGLFIDDELIVQEGVTTVGGVVIESLASSQDSYAMSPNGRYVLFEATLVGSIDGAFIIDRAPLGDNYCVGAVNSSGLGATLSASGSLELADMNLTLRSEGQPGGVSGLYYFGPNQIQAVFGDGFRCVGGALRRVQPPVMANEGGISARSLNFAAPYATSLTPGSLNFQLWYRDPMAGMSGFNLSDGLELVLQ